MRFHVPCRVSMSLRAVGAPARLIQVDIGPFEAKALQEIQRALQLDISSSWERPGIEVLKARARKNEC